MRSAHTFNRSFWIALGFAGATLAVAACGGGGGGEGGGGSGGGSATSSTTTSTSSSSTSASSTSSSTSSGIPMNCTEITAGTFMKTDSDGAVALYSATPSPNLGDMTIEDRLALELYGAEFDPAYDGEATGTFDLSMGGDNNYATCSRCVVLREDPTQDGVAKTYYPVAGSINIDATSDQLNGKIKATITDVTLVEVTIDGSTFESMPVAGGACLHLATATLDVTPPVVPAEWACDPEWYADGACDCGCGVIDYDCADGAAMTCTYNDCGAAGSGGVPVDGMNWECFVPAEWTCDPLLNADGDCDCGCGVQDPDCASAMASECTNNNCAGGAMPKAAENWLCGPPTGWTCDAALYGNGTCNCGCGVQDSDCADAAVATCQSCNDTGSCSTTACPGTIDATNNAVCATP